MKGSNNTKPRFQDLTREQAFGLEARILQRTFPILQVRDTAKEGEVESYFSDLLELTEYLAEVAIGRVSISDAKARGTELHESLNRSHLFVDESVPASMAVLSVTDALGSLGRVRYLWEPGLPDRDKRNPDVAGLLADACLSLNKFGLKDELFWDAAAKDFKAILQQPQSHPLLQPDFFSRPLWQPPGYDSPTGTAMPFAFEAIILEEWKTSVSKFGLSRFVSSYEARLDGMSLQPLSEPTERVEEPESATETRPIVQRLNEHPVIFSIMLLGSLASIIALVYTFWPEPKPVEACRDIGHADNVKAMAALGAKLYAVSEDGQLWWREPRTAWEEIGEAPAIVTMAANATQLLAASDDMLSHGVEVGAHIHRSQIWLRPPGSRVKWEDAGLTDSVTAMAANDDKLFATAKDGRFLWRPTMGDEVNWEQIGSRKDILTMAANSTALFAVTKNGDLLTRAPVNAEADWQHIGRAEGVVALAAFEDNLFGATSKNRLLICGLNLLTSFTGHFEGQPNSSSARWAEQVSMSQDNYGMQRKRYALR